MTGSGAREGFGTPPWNPADPVPDPGDTQGIPGLGDGSANSRASANGGGFAPGGGFTSGTGGAFTPGQADQRTRQEASAPDVEDGVGDTGTAGASGEPGDADASDDGEEPDKPRPAAAKRSTGRRSFWRELPVLIVVALVLALVIKSYAIQAFYIPSGSMQNTLEIGDRVLINKVVYHVRDISRGDIVVFNGDGSWDSAPQPTSSSVFSKFFSDLESIVGVSHDSDVYIKRVIGLPGDHVACCNAQGQVTVNGVGLSESSYLYPGNAPSVQRFNITVPPGRLWVMGDHRFISYDSRGHMGDPGGGTIPESAVMGRAFVIIWPPSRWGFLNIPATFEQPKLNASAAAAGGSPKALATAMDNGVPLQAAGTALPLGLGFAGAIPLTALQAVARRRLSARCARRARRVHQDLDRTRYAQRDGRQRTWGADSA
jgi:signal peptidase I